MANEKKGLVDITTGVEVDDANANGILDLTSDEVTQVGNIDSNTITNAQWGYVGGMNQGVSTSDTPSFTSITAKNGTGYELSIAPDSGGETYIDVGDNVNVTKFNFDNRSTDLGVYGTSSTALIYTDATYDNVGINTETPNAAYKLDVSGSVQVSDGLVVLGEVTSGQVTTDQLELSNGTSVTDIVTTVSASSTNLESPTALAVYNAIGTIANANGIFNLTAAEVTQLENINTSTISTTQWGYVGGLDQGLAKSNSVEFASILTGAITTDQLTLSGGPSVSVVVTTIDASSLDSDSPTAKAVYDAIGTIANANGIFNLTTAEVTQLGNINTSTISTTQWGYVGALNQGLTTTSDVTFNDITANGKQINSVSSIVDVVAATGITAVDDVNIKVRSSTAGDTTVTANPAIVAGTEGQKIVIWGQDNTKTVTFTDGNGLKLDNGQSITLGLDDNISFTYINSNWVETSRIIVS